MPLRGLCNGRYGMSTGHYYGLTISKKMYNFLRKIVEAAMPVNPYNELTATACPRLRTEAARKGRAGSVDTLQAKCKLVLKACPH